MQGDVYFLYALRGLTVDVLIILKVKGVMGASSADLLTLRGSDWIPSLVQEGLHVTAA